MLVFQSISELFMHINYHMQKNVIKGNKHLRREGNHTEKVAGNVQIL